MKKKKKFFYIILFFIFYLFLPGGKNREKAVCRSAFLTTWHSILSAELTKNALLLTIFQRFRPLG